MPPIRITRICYRWYFLW